MSTVHDLAAMTAARERVEAGRTLGRSWYLDREVYEAEREAVFQRSWQYVAHAGELARPGDHVVAPVGDFTVLVTRGQDGVLRAFHNTCQHRGHELVACSGNATSLRCPYHAWTYGLDGRLVGAPHMRRQPGFDPGAVRLHELAVDSWECFVFVSCDPQPPSLASWLGPLAERTAAMDLDFGSLQRFRRIEYEVAANWKIVVENSLECYHCHVAHPELVDLLDMDLFVQEISENGVAMGGPVAQDVKREVSAGSAYEYPDGGVREGQYLYTWPSFYFLVYPGPGNVSNLRFYPRGVDRTLVVREFYFSDAVPEPDRVALTDFVDTIQHQDTGLCESVQRGLRAGGFTEGTLQLVNNVGEYGPHQFYRRYLDQLIAHTRRSPAVP